MPSYPDVNRCRYDFSSVDVNIDGNVFKGFKSVTYSHKLEPGEFRGIGAQVLGRTLGEYSAEGSLEMGMEEWVELRNALGDGFMKRSFPVTVTYANDDQPVTSDELVGCRITSVEKQPSQGSDALSVSLNLSIMYILEDGLKAFPGQLRG